MTHATKQRLIEAGLTMLLEHGYGSLGIQALLDATRTPKGSFYHHFRDKEDFALQVVDAYVGEVHKALDHCLKDQDRPPLDRIRRFFEMTEQKYREDGYMGCLMGGLGQELAATSEAFRHKIEWCFASIAARLAACLDEAKRRGDISPDFDTGRMADVLVDCWEGAALRSRLRRNPESLTTMLEFYLNSVSRAPSPAVAS
jgi:TetR/AcrR family transcriptional repressor of nem operon